MREKYQYAHFPKGRWELTWLGDVKFIRNEYNCLQPVISVTLKEQSTDLFPEFKEVNIAIGQLFNLIPGTVWENGWLVENKLQPSTEIINISTYQAKFIKAGSSLTEDKENPSFWLPFNHHNYHKSHTESWCILFNQGEIDIIVPCAEILRFYFASSSNLIKRIVHTYFNPHTLWREYEYDADTGFLKLILAPEISGISAADIGRIVLDQDAHNAVNMVSKQLIASVANGDKAYIKMPLPFKGKTKLKVLGRQVKVDGAVPRFIVTQILSCTHPLPFSRLRYISHTQFKKGQEAALMAKQTDHDQAHKLAAASNKKIDKLTNQEPSHNSKAKIKSWDTSVRFPDLLRKEVIRITPDQTETIMIRQSEASGVGSTGDGVGNNSDIAKVDLCVSAPFVLVEDKPLKSPVPGWEKYFEFLQHLAKESWVDSLEFVQLDPRQVEKHYFELPNFVDEYGVIIFHSDFVEQQVYVSICKMSTKTQVFWLFSSTDEKVDKKIGTIFVLDENFGMSWGVIYQLFQTGLSKSLIGSIDSIVSLKMLVDKTV